MPETEVQGAANKVVSVTRSATRDSFLATPADEPLGVSVNEIALLHIANLNVSELGEYVKPRSPAFERETA
jgi:hypothetical protein